MKRLVIVATLVALGFAALVAFAPTAATQPTGWLSYLLQDPQGVVQFRALDQWGSPVMIGHGTAVPTVANSGNSPMDGELFEVHAAATAPVLRVYSATATTWYDVPYEDTMTLTGAWTFDANIVIGASEEDTFTVNGTTEFNVRHEPFDQVGCAEAYEEDMTAAVVTDAGENFILMPCSQLGVIAYRLEAPGGPGLADTPAPFAVDGVFSTDGYVDPADNEGVEFVFGSFGPDMLGAYFDEDSNLESFAEASITIADISDLDDLWFGFVVQEAYDNPPASDTFDTSALFVISDLAGDLDIETELNGGGTLNDDAVTVWGDGETHVLKVVVGADAVEFWLDGVQVAQVNAVLNMDATDRAVVVLGYTLVAASDPDVDVNHLTIGQEL